MTINCPYCSAPAVLTTGAHIYPNRPDLEKVKIWRCTPCNAYVGCHPGTETPLGRLADRELRDWKRRAHAAFDRFWKNAKLRKNKKSIARGNAYAWLAAELNVERASCHIGMFDIELCRRTVEICERKAAHENEASRGHPGDLEPVHPGEEE